MKTEIPSMNITFESDFKNLLDNTVGVQFAAQKERAHVYEAVKALVMPVVCRQLQEYNITTDSIKDSPGDNGPWPLIYNFSTVIKDDELYCSLVFNCHYANTTLGNVVNIWIDTNPNTIITVYDLNGNGISDGVLELFNTFDNFLDCFKPAVETARRY